MNSAARNLSGMSIFHIRIAAILVVLACMIQVVVSTRVHDTRSYACTAESNTTHLPFCNHSLSILERVRDLVDRLSAEEKFELMSSTQQSIKRLGIPPYEWSNECLHGAVVRGDAADAIPSGGATVFPQPIGLAASFNEDLLGKIGVAISTEARALFNHGVERTKGIPGFLNCWSPNINIFRDPRWGRGSETYGEDPMLTSMMLQGMIGGLQSPQQGVVKVISVPKHLVGYSLEEAEGQSRTYFDARISAQDLEDTYLPAFKSSLTNAGARGIMCSYNQLNGRPMCANPDILEKVLRTNWSYSGHVVSDCGAVSNIFNAEQRVPTMAAAAAEAVNAGTDLNCGDGFDAVPTAVGQGLVHMDAINQAISRTLRGRMELGLFDPDKDPFGEITISEVGSPPHLDLAKKAAVESIVLLKNADRQLPLALAGQSVAVIGPQANDSMVLLGNYHGRAAHNNVSTPFAAISKRLHMHNGSATYSQGCFVTGDGAWQFDAALAAARAADVAVVLVGGSSKGTIEGVTHLDTTEKESLDRKTITLPGLQDDLITALSTRTRVPIVVVLIGGGPLAIEHVYANKRVSAILQAWYPGQMGGEAIADVLFGAVSPSGRLPVTMYHANYTEQVAMTNMDMRGWPGRTHRFLQVPVLFPFGYGLSYASFAYIMTLGGSPTATSGVRTIALAVRNTGTVASDHTVLLFVSYAGGAAGAVPPQFGVVPVQELVRVQRLRLVPPGDTVHVTFQLSSHDLALATVAGERLVPAGTWVAHVARGGTARTAAESIAEGVTFTVDP
eukprot:m.513317 g.513317  ORF g.513317 m.513317 type:complete len:786 (+) comp21904_c0_seq3:179-2536(+)